MSFVPNSFNEQLSLFDSFTGLTAREKKFLALMFDVRFQYALHTTSYREQPSMTGSLAGSAHACWLMRKKPALT